MKQPLRVVADANIPFAREAFGWLGNVEMLPGAGITPEKVRRADVLLVRSVTRVDAALLGGSSVRFVGTATIGTDHVDLEYLRRQSIAFASAPGSNAESVVEYVLAALLCLSAARDRPLRGQTVGVVGVGNVGRRLVPRLEALGLRVLPSDPPRARQEGGDFWPLNRLLPAADIVTLHVPLVRAGEDATAHLIGADALGQMKKGAWLVNAARGAVVDNGALLASCRAREIGAAVLDVWEGEPTPLPPLVAAADVATPHIAGYSFDGKVAGTRAIVQALEAWTGTRSPWPVESALAPHPGDALELRAPGAALPEHQYLHALARQMYDVQADSARLKSALSALPPEKHADAFRALRRDYPRRRRWGLFSVAGSVPAAYRAAVREGLGLG